MFPHPLALVTHWNAEHRSAWIAKYAPKPRRPYRVVLGLPTGGGE